VLRNVTMGDATLWYDGLASRTRHNLTGDDTHPPFSGIPHDFLSIRQPHGSLVFTEVLSAGKER